jgi:hypothetical protein
MAVLTQVSWEGSSNYTLAASLDSLSSALFIAIDGTVKEVNK